MFFFNCRFFAAISVRHSHILKIYHQITHAVFLASSGKIRRQIWLCFEKATCASVTLELFDAVEEKLFSLLVSALLTKQCCYRTSYTTKFGKQLVSSCWTSGKI